MKRIIIMVFVGLTASACSQNEKPQSTAPADYAETYDKLIQNPEKDSANTDSTATANGQNKQADSTLQNR